MRRLLIKWLLASAVLVLASHVISGVHVRGLGGALWASLVYGVLFVLLGWLVGFVVTVLSIVPGVLTFGLFFVLVPILTNAVLLKMTAGMLGSFAISTWTAAFLLSLTLTLLDLLIDPSSKRRYRS
jgi:putative membrane protein